MAWGATAILFLHLFVLFFLEGQTSPIAYPVTQEQLAQYVAAQQTQQSPQSALLLTPQRYVSSAGALPRQRQSYLLEQEPLQQQTYQDEGQPAAQQPLLYYRQQQQQQQRPQLLKKYTGKQLGQDQQQQQQEDYDPNPQYQFSFDIKDDESTNYHNRKETRDGDKISGSYSVVDSDGYIRTVTYTADPREGFKADVDRRPTDIVVKLPKHPTPGLAQQYQQISPASAHAQALVARKQQTQQYLEASSPVDAAEQQFAIKSHEGQIYVPQQPQRSAAAQNAGTAYFAPHRLSPAAIPVSAKALKTYDPAAITGPLLYKSYSQ